MGKTGFGSKPKRTAGQKAFRWLVAGALATGIAGGLLKTNADYRAAVRQTVNEMHLQASSPSNHAFYHDAAILLKASLPKKRHDLIDDYLRVVDNLARKHDIHPARVINTIHINSAHDPKSAKEAIVDYGKEIERIESALKKGRNAAPVEENKWEIGHYRRLQDIISAFMATESALRDFASEVGKTGLPKLADQVEFRWLDYSGRRAAPEHVERRMNL